MPPIRQMDPHLAAKIAAGEVIERPASVVKELVENAIDSGARHIRVEIDGGGIERINVADDGCGMRPDEVELAFRRHATSKLFEEEGLSRLETLGFRGEALPSIAAVADVTCVTRSADERAAIELRVDQGAMERRVVARQPGTTLTVERLFARFPARRKFLRTRSAELTACVQVLAALSLAYPEIQLVVEADGREVLRTPGDGSLRSAALAVLGPEADPHLLDVPETSTYDDEGMAIIQVRGLCAAGSYHRGSRSGLHVLVNRRPVQNRALSYAVVEAYGTLLPVGRQPVAVLDLRVAPSEVDFNVHPSKLEVKLLRERAAYAGLQRAVRAALGSGAWNVASWGLGTDNGASAPNQPVGVGGEWDVIPAAGEHAFRRDEDLISGGERLAELRVLGQVGRTYLIAEGDAGLYLVDQHAAHERVLLEELRAGLSEQAQQQLLLEPMVLDLAAEATALLETTSGDLKRLGFEMEPFGPRQALLRAVPAVLAQRYPARALPEALAALATDHHGLTMDADSTWTERLALTLACKCAVRAGDTLSDAEMQALLRRLGEAALCRTCAHGRPTAILLSHAQLERQFGRR